MEAKYHDSPQKKFSDFIRNRPPVPVLLICIFESLGLLLLPSAFASEDTLNFGLLYQMYLVLTGVLSIVIIYTLWKLKKIGILIYTGAYLIHNIVALIFGNWMIGVLVIPLIGLILIGLSRKKFN